MVYKKYIKRDGKIYGPYKYHSRKVNGKVITDYLGKDGGKTRKNKTLIFVIVGFLLLFSLVFVLNYSNISSTWAVDLVNSVSGIISSSLTSIKTMTGFVVSEDTNESEKVQPEKTEEADENTNNSKEEEMQDEATNETTSEPDNITKEEPANETILEKTNETQEENKTSMKNITIENQTIVSNLTSNETINETTPESNLTNITETNQTIINKTIIKENITEQIPENITEINITDATIITTQYQAVIGKPVKWKKHISLEEPKNLTVKLPGNSKNINIKKVEENKSNLPTPLKITGQVIGGESEGFLSRLFKKIFRLTGGAIGTEETQEEIEVELDDTATEYEIEYETPAPEAFEEAITNGKKITIIGPENLHYENILAFVDLPKESSKNNIRLYRTTSGIREQLQITNYDDTNENGLIDYIEWIVPHLSEQTFEITIGIYPEIINGAYQFDGVDDYIDAGNNSNLNFGTGDFTVEAWFKLSSYPTNKSYGYPIIQKANTAYTDGWWLWVLNMPTNSPPYEYNTKLRFAIFGEGIVQANGAGTTALELDTWYHAVGVKGANYTEMYLNGVKEYSSPYLSINSDSTENLLIGTWIDFGSYFNGTIDEVIIFNRSLSTDEITALYEQRFTAHGIQNVFDLKVDKEVIE